MFVLLSEGRSNATGEGHSPLQDCSHFRHQVQVGWHPGSPLTFDQRVTNLGIPMDSLRFDNLLEQLTEFRKVLYF